MALRAVPDHPKFAHLKALLGMSKGATLGYLECIWHFTGRFTPQGNIGKYEDSAIEAWVEWSGDAGALVAALIEARWIDRDEQHRLLVHDWSSHADKATKNALGRAKLKFCTPGVRTESPGVRTASRKVSTVSRLPEPVPEPEPVPVPETPPAAKIAAACDVAAETFELSDEERAGAWSRANPAGPSKKSLLSPELEAALANCAGRIHARHPAVRRCGLTQVKTSLRAIARLAELAKRLEALRMVDQNHAGWCATADWQKENGQYAKGLDNWLAPTKRRWADPPPRAQRGEGSKRQSGSTVEDEYLPPGIQLPEFGDAA
jgi:hypothetical protein